MLLSSRPFLSFLPFLLVLLVTSPTTATLDAVRIIQQIAPQSISCPPSNSDCRTARQAAPFIAHSLARYGIYKPNLMAAVLALMAFESVDFQYKHNVSPGRPGQGTANMQMPTYNLLYAQQIPALRDKAIRLCPSSTVEGQSPQTLNAILALVTPDEYNFGSGPWFLMTQCEPEVREALAKDADRGFGLYMKCVGVEVTEERRAYWERAKKAFGV
ncbi:hypothetical protein E4U54_003565 [Claviceps lovelessii]|nr:hypothetical protein E4U54_003565 [Claviceps lovelessii]